MSHFFLKGKGKRLPSPSASSDEDAGTRQDAPLKTPQFSSKECVQEKVLAKLGGNTASGPSKGMTAFSSLISRPNLFTAKAETNRGQRRGSSMRISSRNSGPKANKAQDPDTFLIGAVVFLVVGVAENTVEDDDTPGFSPVYCLRTEVDITPLGLTGMHQSGLHVSKPDGITFRTTNTYTIIDNKLANLFPQLYEWLVEEDSTDSSSSWLICAKNKYRGLLIYSDDQVLPNGMDILNACILSAPKAGPLNCTLYLVTWNTVPSATIKSWRPKPSNTMVPVVDKDVDDSSDDFDTSSDLPAVADILQCSHLRQHRRSLHPRQVARNEKSKVEHEVIELSEDSDNAQNTASATTDPATPPFKAKLNNTFYSSMHFDGDDNPWN